MKHKRTALLLIVITSFLLHTSGTGWSQSMEMPAAGVVTPLLQYQGRLTDPATGQVVADGSYTMTFELYSVEVGGLTLWSEKESVKVEGGLFSTVLGDATALSTALFNGQALWLAVVVEGELLGPRQPLLPVAYAVSLVPGAVVGGDSAPVLQVNHSGAGEALRVGGNLSVSGSLLGGSHLHDERYFTEVETDSRFVNAAGDTMSGALTVPRIDYASPRTQYYRLGGEDFVPGSNVPYTNTYGNGGASIESGWGALVAPVHLPQGAVVTSFQVFFNDNSASNMIVRLDCLWGTGGYFINAQVNSVGLSGYADRTDTTIDDPKIDNTSCSYHVYAWADAWDGSNLLIMGALITYTISEAQ